MHPSPLQSYLPLAAVFSCLVFLSTFSSIMDFLRELSLCIMYPKYDNLNLVICTSSECFGLICYMIHVFVSWLSVIFTGIFFNTEIQKLFLFCIFRVQLLFPWILQKKNILIFVGIDVSQYLNIFSKVFFGTLPNVVYFLTAD